MQKCGPTENRTPIAGFKVPSATDYTIGPLLSEINLISCTILFMNMLQYGFHLVSYLYRLIQ